MKKDKTEAMGEYKEEEEELSTIYYADFVRLFYVRRELCNEHSLLNFVSLSNKTGSSLIEYRGPLYKLAHCEYVTVEKILGVYTEVEIYLDLSKNEEITDSHPNDFYFSYSDGTLGKEINSVLLNSAFIFELLVFVAIKSISRDMIMHDSADRGSRFGNFEKDKLKITNEFDLRLKNYSANPEEIKKLLESFGSVIYRKAKNLIIRDLSKISSLNLGNKKNKKKIVYFFKNEEKLEHSLQRNKCLSDAFAYVKSAIQQMITSSSKNQCVGYNPDVELKSQGDLFNSGMNWSEAVVFLHPDDLEDGQKIIRNDIENLKQMGVRFFGISFMLPGTFFVFSIRFLMFLFPLIDETDQDLKIDYIKDFIKRPLIKTFFLESAPGKFIVISPFGPRGLWLNNNKDSLKPRKDVVLKKAKRKLTKEEKKKVISNIGKQFGRFFGGIAKAFKYVVDFFKFF